MPLNSPLNNHLFWDRPIMTLVQWRSVLQSETNIRQTVGRQHSEHLRGNCVTVSLQSRCMGWNWHFYFIYFVFFFFLKVVLSTGRWCQLFFPPPPPPQGLIYGAVVSEQPTTLNPVIGVCFQLQVTLCWTVQESRGGTSCSDVSNPDVNLRPTHTLYCNTQVQLWSDMVCCTYTNQTNTHSVLVCGNSTQY